MICDECGKERHGVKTVHKDSNGHPEIGLCFLCTKENARGRFWDARVNKYTQRNDLCTLSDGSRAPEHLLPIGKVEILPIGLGEAVRSRAVE